MKSQHVHFRPFHPSDYQALEAIIRDTWEYDAFCSPTMAKRISKLYLASCLVNQTYTCVAIRDGEPVGIIMGKNEMTYRKPWRYTVRQSLAMLQMVMSSEGRKIARVFEEIDTIDDYLLEDTDTFFQGELAFFVVRDDQQGTGIGKKLYQHFLNYLASENLDNFFLFTDNTCNVGFYEHHGLTKLAQKNIKLSQMKKDMEFYVYGTSISPDKRW